MSVRVRYRASDLGEGVVEVFKEADGYRVLDDNTLELREVWEEDGTVKYSRVGVVHPDRWDSAVIESAATTEGA